MFLKLAALLEKYQLIKDGLLQLASVDIPFSDQKSLSALAHFISKNEVYLDRISPWFSVLGYMPQLYNG